MSGYCHVGIRGQRYEGILGYSYRDWEFIGIFYVGIYKYRYIGI